MPNQFFNDMQGDRKGKAIGKPKQMKPMGESVNVKPAFNLDLPGKTQPGGRLAGVKKVPHPNEKGL